MLLSRVLRPGRTLFIRPRKGVLMSETIHGKINDLHDELVRSRSVIRFLGSSVEALFSQNGLPTEAVGVWDMIDLINEKMCKLEDSLEEILIMIKRDSLKA